MRRVGIFISIMLARSLSYPLLPPSQYFSPKKQATAHRFRGHRLFLGVINNRNGERKISENVQFELFSSILDIRAEEWDGCLENNASPFTEHSWLRCLEESNCVSQETGWIPQHVAIKIDGDICGYVPLYMKTNSMGEFIFDSGWAEAANASGIGYYPKLLVGVPFTPATCSKILLNPTITKKFSRSEICCLREMVAAFLKGFACGNNLSSVHMNFLTEEEVVDISGKLKSSSSSAFDRDLGDGFNSIIERLEYADLNGFLRRTSLQYHWSNTNAKNNGLPYKNFDEYLDCFKSKRRISIRRERKKVQIDEDIRIDAVVGKDILKYDGLVERMFEIYLSTVNKMFWGRQYLSLDFFKRLTRTDFVDKVCFICARRRSTGETLRASDVFAGTFNIVKNGVFYGRYWGCLEEVKSLHFETCYWAAIEYCIENGLQRMEPGAGGGGKQSVNRCFCQVRISHFVLSLPCVAGRLQVGPRI